MDAYLQEYLPIAVFLGIAVALSAAFVIGSVLLGAQRPDPEKLSAYECGFETFVDFRSHFDRQLYFVAVMFFLYTFVVPVLFPWAVSLGKIGAFGFWSMMIFLGVLTVGFIYEWKKGALEWD